MDLYFIKKINQQESYTILISISLYILYIQVIELGMTFPKTEYEVYSKSEKNNFEQLNLEVCKDIKINKSISINISENEIDKYNSSSG